MSAISLTSFGAKIQVQGFESGISAKEFGENYEDRVVIKELPYASSLPDRAIRDQALKESGVLGVEKYEKMDDLDRDLMFLKAKRLSVADLKKNYPGLSDKILKKLKKEVAK